MARVDSWRLIRLLGQGGMGTVYLAERPDGRVVDPGARCAAVAVPANLR